ncbi:MAG: DNA polymerase III subunit beta [Paenibacillaceae bacterium]
MIIEIQKLVIKEQLDHAVKGVSSKITIPILGGVKFEVTDKGLTLTGSDTETVIQMFIPSEQFKTIEKGSIVLEKGDLEKTIAKMPNEIIRIQTESNLNTIFSAKKAELQLMGMNATEYPDYSVDADDEQIIINGEVLKNLIKQTHFAASDKEDTPILKGTVISVNEGVIQFLTCDRHRLAKVRENIETDVEKSMVVSTSCLINLSKIINGKDEIAITAKSGAEGVTQVNFTSSDMMFVARVLSGSYPDTSKLIPERFTEIFTINRVQLISSLELAKITTDGGKTNVAKFQFSKNELIVSSKNEKGQMKESLDVENLNGNDFIFSANAEYILSALKAVESEFVKINATGAMNPIVITPEEDDNVLFLVLPYRTTN